MVPPPGHGSFSLSEGSRKRTFLPRGCSRKSIVGARFPQIGCQIGNLRLVLSLFGGRGSEQLCRKSFCRSHQGCIERWWPAIIGRERGRQGGANIHTRRRSQGNVR